MTAATPPAESAGPVLPLAELVERVETVAVDVRAGLHDVRADPDERWHVRLYRDDAMDLWLISWTPDQGTQLHDHGGSGGAFTVVSGSLRETIWAPGAAALRDADRRSGDTVVFGQRYVHDVRNVETETAVSVHAYSPPLSRMGFYDVEDDGRGTGRLVRLGELWTDDPEAEAPASVTRARRRRAS